MTLQVDELGQLILNVCRAAPDGVVVFLPSYDYETTVHARWAASGALANIGKVKTVFREPRASTDVEATLAAYAECIRAAAAAAATTGTGAQVRSPFYSQLLSFTLSTTRACHSF